MWRKHDLCYQRLIELKKTVFIFRVAVYIDQVVSWSDHQTMVMKGLNERKRDEPRGSLCS